MPRRFICLFRQQQRAAFNNFSLAYTPVSQVYGIIRYFMPGFINIFMLFWLGGTFYRTARATDILEIIIYIPTGKYSTSQTESMLFMGIYLRYALLISSAFSDLSKYIQ